MVYDTTEQDTDMEEFTKEAELLEDTFDADDDTEKIMFIDKDNPIDSIPTDATSSTDTSSTDIHLLIYLLILHLLILHLLNSIY